MRLKPCNGLHSDIVLVTKSRRHTSKLSSSAQFGTNDNMSKNLVLCRNVLKPRTSLSLMNFCTFHIVVKSPMVLLSVLLTAK